MATQNQEGLTKFPHVLLGEQLIWIVADLPKSECYNASIGLGSEHFFKQIISCT